MVEITNHEIIDYITHAVENARGDDLERARASFRGMSSAQMDAPHGTSGKTRQQILNGYVEQRALHFVAVGFLQGMIARSGVK